MIYEIRCNKFICFIDISIVKYFINKLPSKLFSFF